MLFYFQDTQTGKKTTTSADLVPARLTYKSGLRREYLWIPSQCGLRPLVRNQRIREFEAVVSGGKPQKRTIEQEY